MKTLTDQQKLEILCAYLPHGVEVEWIRPDDNAKIVSKLTISDYPFLIGRHNGNPILRHPDDMTEEERLEKSRLWAIADETERYTDIHKALNYMHSRLIDTFGAIEAGFAVRKNINEKGE
jgi:hypothetical protein